MPYAVENVREVIGKKPVFGICMGHQLLGQAFGGSTFKLKFGHHGGNHPIRFEETSKPLALLTCLCRPMKCLQRITLKPLAHSAMSSRSMLI